MPNNYDPVKAMQALHAYESLEPLEDDGDEDATYLRDRLWERWIDAWEDLKPMVNNQD